MPAAYADGISEMTGADRPSARVISANLVLPPYRGRRRNVAHKTDMLTYIGQFFNHDIDLAMDAHEAEWANITIPEGDFHFDPFGTGSETMPFQRSGYNTSRPASATREQVNTITSYLDGSVVYGESLEKADKLRAHYKGKMSTFNGMLPTNFMGVTMANPAGVEKDTDLRAAGDVRANVNAALLAIQTLFIREHNRLAEEIEAKNPTWTDEQIFREARKWNVAIMQAICFYEYLPMLGFQVPPYAGYDSSINVGKETKELR
ncbi:unnamed protein product [Ostreobium quekettii]|uniref:Peroxidase n=1 Tax=Ostreobium quekettii TaxID=121088 RepID=A0A8S1JAJ7_9CHLO|nr:unnamed protein product [Ostreobium quekettii]